MKIQELWQGIKTGNCETCGKDCKGKLNYGELCANIKYLKDYAEKNYEKNRETFAKLKKVMGEQKPAIFSFGCGIGLDLLGAKEHFGSDVVYYPIDECKWAICDTENYRNFEPKLPNRIMKFDEGIMMLTITQRNPVLCFFNSIFSITENTDLKAKLVSTLQMKNNFYIVCNYTVSSDFHLMSVELNFIKELLHELRSVFAFKKIDILGDKGIIISGIRK